MDVSNDAVDPAAESGPGASTSPLDQKFEPHPAIAPLSWLLGTWDLRAMRDGHMDPAGESMTRTGQVCGIVATVLLMLGTIGSVIAFGTPAPMTQVPTTSKSSTRKITPTSAPIGR